MITILNMITIMMITILMITTMSWPVLIMVRNMTLVIIISRTITVKTAFTKNKRIGAKLRGSLLFSIR